MADKRIGTIDYIYEKIDPDYSLLFEFGSIGGQNSRVTYIFPESKRFSSLYSARTRGYLASEKQDKYELLVALGVQRAIKHLSSASKKNGLRKVVNDFKVPSFSTCFI